MSIYHIVDLDTEAIIYRDDELMFDGHANSDAAKLLALTGDRVMVALPDGGVGFPRAMHAPASLNVLFAQAEQFGANLVWYEQPSAQPLAGAAPNEPPLIADDEHGELVCVRTLLQALWPQSQAEKGGMRVRRSYWGGPGSMQIPVPISVAPGDLWAFMRVSDNGTAAVGIHSGEYLKWSTDVPVAEAAQALRARVAAITASVG